MSRDPLDRYYTPPRFADAICDYLAREGCMPASILDPSAGGGHLLARARLRWPDAKTLGADVDPEATGHEHCTERWLHFDWLSAPVGGAPERADLVLTNPPYRGAVDHLERSIAAADKWCVAILRGTILESDARVDFWRHHPPWRVLRCVQRVSFIGTGSSDTVSPSVIIWRTGGMWSAETTMDLLDWRGRHGDPAVGVWQSLPRPRLRSRWPRRPPC